MGSRRRAPAAGAAVVLCAAVLSSTGVHAYLPGVGPVPYQAGAPIPVFVNELSSVKTQIPFAYHSLPFCKPEVQKLAHENLGSALEGEVKEESVYALRVGVNEMCSKACEKSLSKKDAYDIMKAIDDAYQVHMTVDKLPNVREVEPEAGAIDEYNDGFYVKGFPVGFRSGEKYFIYNHLNIIVAINSPLNNDAFNVVGFLVEPVSASASTFYSCSNANGIQSSKNWQEIDAQLSDAIIYSYDVEWETTDMPWTQRWDIYAAGGGDQIHWFSITNSTLIVIFLTVLVAMILIRALRKDIQKYNAQDAEDAKDESGWKLVHGDVFRAPDQHPMLFAVCIGSGVQLLIMTFLVVVFSVMGLLSPTQRGNILTSTMLIFVLMGSFAGYHASRIHKMFRGASWIKMTVMTATMYPGLCFTIFFGLNLALAAKGSTAAVSFTSLLVLLLLWLLVQTPLVFAGSYVGFKREVPEQPVRTNQIPRMIKEQPWYLSPVVAVPFSGILPFGAISVELFFIMTSVWRDQVFYIFGFLLVVLVILVATCAEISIVLCYFQLCSEDYRWWWRSLLWSGSCAVYMFFYSAWYFYAELDMSGLVSFLLYFGYMAVLSISLFLMTGVIGYFSCYWFISKIYGSIKVD